jgi:hypothetical protein
MCYHCLRLIRISTLGDLLLPSSGLKVEGVGSSDMLVLMYQSEWALLYNAEISQNFYFLVGLDPGMSSLTHWELHMHYELQQDSQRRIPHSLA